MKKFKTFITESNLIITHAAMLGTEAANKGLDLKSAREHIHNSLEVKFGKQDITSKHYKKAMLYARDAYNIASADYITPISKLGTNSYTLIRKK